MQVCTLLHASKINRHLVPADGDLSPKNVGTYKLTYDNLFLCTWCETVSTMHGIKCIKTWWVYFENSSLLGCDVVHRYQSSGVAGCLHAQDSPRRVTRTFVPIYQSTRQLRGLVSSSAPPQEPQIAHTHPCLFTDTNCVSIPSSHNLYISLTDLRLPFESILAIIRIVSNYRA
jgi:hypothetical protein